MDLFSYCQDQIKWEIPREIIQEAFMPRKYDPARRERYRDNQLGLNVDSIIRREVLEARVGVDVNLCSGVETTIRLTGIPMDIIDPWNIIYRIPQSMTGGRQITAVYSVTFGEGNVIGSNRMMMKGGSPLLEAAAGIYMSQAPIPAVHSPYVTLVGDNTVLINDAQALPGILYLRCMLTHEPNFNNIKPAYYRKFAELAILAAKAYIYNRLIIQLDEGEIKAGISIGRFREIVDSYADANQMYKEFLHDKWRVSSVCNDTEKYRRILRFTVGGRR